MSGVYYGLFVLNTKVTGLAILPFLLLWTTIDLDENENENDDENEKNKQNKQGTYSISMISVRLSAPVLLKASAVIIGTLIGHAPWLMFYYSVTGKLLPTAWPSEELLKRSQFVKKAVEKPWYSYLQTICTISPLMACGLIIGGVCLLLTLYHIMTPIMIDIMRMKEKYGRYSTKKIREMNENELRRTWLPMYRLGVLVLWPLGYIVGHTLLAALGAGTQTRFILAAVPGCSVLLAIAIDKVLQTQLYPLIFAPLILLLFIQAIHCVYYGILYPSMHADFDLTLYQMISLMLNSPYHVPSTKDSFLATGMFMRHFGLDLLG